MVYLVDEIKPEIFHIEQGAYMLFYLWETSEQRVLAWIENERCRSLFSRDEIINLFKPKSKIQMVQIKNKIRLKKFDKVIYWNPEGRYFVLEVTKFEK